MTDTTTRTIPAARAESTETERRNRENETGEQSQEQSQSGQQSGFGQQTENKSGQQPEFGQQSDTLTTDQTQSEQSEASPAEGEPGFVGSGGDQSSDYLTKGENQDFQPEGQGASDTDAGTSDITTGQPTSSDSTLDDGSDTSR